MRYPLCGVVVTFIISLVTITFAEVRTKQTVPKPPEGYAIIEEDYLVRFNDEPEYRFHEARKHYLKKDLKSAAAQIRKAAVIMRLEASAATGEGKQNLMASVQELEKLADSVEKGSVTSVKELDKAFARANLALATLHYRKASESWTKKEFKKAGHDLQAAALDIEHAIAWSGLELEASTKAVIEEAGNLAGKMIAGTGWIPQEISKILEEIAGEIEKLGKKIEPMKR